MVATFDRRQIRMVVGIFNNAALGRQRYAENKNNPTRTGLSRSDWPVKYRTKINTTIDSKITAKLMLQRAAPIVLITPLPKVQTETRSALLSGSKKHRKIRYARNMNAMR